ncbi:MAG: histidine phosphatase family protein [Pirellulales bacterium]
MTLRIGLLRHFPVSEQLPAGWRTADELAEWRAIYDRSETIVGPYDLAGIDWQSCVASDLSRTIATAQRVFAGPFTTTPLLREPEFATFATGRLRLPLRAWQVVLQIAWLSGHRSQRDHRDDFRRRVSAVADQLSAATRDTLVVSHAGMMAYLGRELCRRGFRGPTLRIAKHARAYVYTCPD